MNNFVFVEIRNDKLSTRMDRDPFEKIRYAEGECQDWFKTNDLTIDLIQTLVATSIFSGCGWM